MSFSIEIMEEKYIKYIADLERTCFSKPWTERGLQAELLNENAHFYVAVLYGRVIGYVGFHSAADEGYIANIAVHSNYRKMGCASMLLKNAINQAKKLGLAFLSLEVRPSNETAIHLYKNFGFEEVGIRKGFYTEPKEDGLIMTKYFKVSPQSVTETTKESENKE